MSIFHPNFPLMQKDTIPIGKYKVGQAVWAKVFPEQELQVRRYIDRIYFCTVAGEPEHADFAYYARELMSEAERKA